MKRLILALALLAITATARADWSQISGSNLWTWNDASGSSNGLTYTRSTSWVNGRCQYVYTQYGSIQPAAQPATPYKALKPSEPNFELELLKAWTEQTTLDKRHGLLRDLGIASGQQQTATQQSSYATQQTRSTTIQQGFAEPGTIAYGYSAYSAQQYQPVSEAERLHAQQRQAELLYNLQAQQQLYAAAHDQKVQENNKFLIAGQIANSALMIVTAQNSQETTTTTTVPQPPPPQVPQNFTQPQQGAAAQPRANLGRVVAEVSCLQCHGAQPKDNDLVLTNLKDRPWTEKGPILEKIRSRMNLPPSDPKHMPKGPSGQQGAQLPIEQQQAMIQWLSQ